MPESATIICPGRLAAALVYPIKSPQGIMMTISLQVSAAKALKEKEWIDSVAKPMIIISIAAANAVCIATKNP